MKSRIAILPLFLAVYCVAGRTQSVTPSITIGTHVLTLGMPESTVLDELGTDFIMRKFPSGVKPASAMNPPVSAWGAQRKTESGFVMVGSVTFDDHKLTTAIRYWDIQKSSSKSLFYAMNEAMQSLEHDGLTACQIAAYGANRTIDSPNSTGSGSLDTKEILFDCGVKQVKISLNVSDTPGMSPEDIQVTEWLQRKYK